MRRLAQRQDGFTLIDTLVAVVIMGTTVVALVTVLTNVVVTTQFHRGNAVAEDVTHNAVEAVVARMSTKTTLSTDVGASTTNQTLAVQSAAGFAGFAWVNVDDEMMALTGVNTSTTPQTLTVTRAPGDPTALNAHAAGAAVVPAYRCPAKGELTPDWAGLAPTGVTSTITSVEYWDPVTATFVAATACGTSYDARCLMADGTAGDRRAGCDVGTYRIELKISTAADSRYKGVTATTSGLVRRGSA